MTEPSKTSKKPYFGTNFSTFCPILVNNKFPSKIELCEFLNIPADSHCAKKSVKTNVPFRKKDRNNGQTARRADRQTRAILYDHT